MAQDKQLHVLGRRGTGEQHQPAKKLDDDQVEQAQRHGVRSSLSRDGDDGYMRTRPVWLVLLAIVVLTLVAWLSTSSIGPAWLKTSMLVGVIVLGAFAQSFVDLVRKRAADQRKAFELPEQPPPDGGPARLLRADQHIVPFIGRASTPR